MEKLFKKIKKETLSPDEKIKILSVLHDFVAENPMQNIRSPYLDFWFIFKQKTIVIPITAALILILTGSTAFAAKKSLPGDILFPVKMLKEKVEAFMTTNTKTRAQVEVSHAISRLQEVEQVVTSNKQLNKGAGKEISNNFETQMEDVVDNVNKLKDNGQMEDASAIWSDFKKSVAEHEKTITELSNSTSTGDETKQELDNMVFDIHSQLENKTDEDNRKSEKSNNDSNDFNQTNGEVKGVETGDEIETKQTVETHRESKTKENDSGSYESETRDN